VPGAGGGSTRIPACGTNDFAERALETGKACALVVAKLDRLSHSMIDFPA
jgi:hypothetical protein